jgi:hypothetical protein
MGRVNVRLNAPANVLYNIMHKMVRKYDEAKNAVAIANITHSMVLSKQLDLATRRRQMRKQYSAKTAQKTLHFSQ